MKNRLKELRKKANLSQEELANRVGTSRGQIIKLENGERRLSQKWMELIAPHLGCLPGELISEISHDLPPAATGLPAKAVDLLEMAYRAITEIAEETGLNLSEEQRDELAAELYLQKLRDPQVDPLDRAARLVLRRRSDNLAQ